MTIDELPAELQEAARRLREEPPPYALGLPPAGSQLIPGTDADLARLHVRGYALGADIVWTYLPSLVAHEGLMVAYVIAPTSRDVAGQRCVTPEPSQLMGLYFLQGRHHIEPVEG